MTIEVIVELRAEPGRRDELKGVLLALATVLEPA
jgi:hypothetical protein